MNWISIPQMFSTLFGQILPGFVLLALLVATLLGPESAVGTLLEPEAQSRLFSAGAIVVALLVSQAIGMLMGQLWTSTVGRLMRKAETTINRRCSKERLDEHNRMLEGLNLPPLSILSEQLPEPFIMHDHLHLSAPQEAARLLKVRAERRQCHTLAFGAGLLALLNLHFCLQTPSLERVVWETALLLTVVVSSLRSYRLVGFITNGITSTWLCLASGKMLRFQTNARGSLQEGAAIEGDNQARQDKAEKERGRSTD